VNGKEVKFFELRDSMTFIPVVCFRINPEELEDQDRWLAGRAGIRTTEFVYMIELTSDRMHWDPDRWGGNDRDTRAVCHNHIRTNWESLSSGDVIDAEYILGLQSYPRASERLGEPHEFTLEELTGVSSDGRTETNRNIDKYLEEKRVKK